MPTITNTLVENRAQTAVEVKPEVDLDNLLYLICDAKKRVTVKNPSKDDKIDLYNVLSSLEQKILMIQDGAQLII